MTVCTRCGGIGGHRSWCPGEPRTPASALSPAEAARVAAFDAAPTPPECDPERVETVARAIYGEGAYCGDCPYSGWDDCPECRRYARGYARAAIAALPPSPAEEAVKRVEAVCDERSVAAFRNGQQYVRVSLVRAALASPAPAPQGEEPTGCGCGVPGCVWGHGA